MPIMLVAAPDDLRVPERLRAARVRGDQGRRRSVEDGGVHRGGTVRVQDDPERVRPPGELLLYRKVGVVHEDGPDADEDRVARGAELVDALQVVVVRDPDALAGGERDLPVRGHRGVHDDVGSHGPPKKPRVNEPFSEGSFGGRP